MDQKENGLRTNVFIDYQIIQNSNLQNLILELDIMIAAGKKIYLWSKTILPETMEKECKKRIVKIDDHELELHKTIYEERKKGITYQEISDKTGIPVKQLTYYIKHNPNVPLVLDDWIVDYYKKDSSSYQKADIVIDPDQKFVDRFIKIGLEGNCIKSV